MKLRNWMLLGVVAGSLAACGGSGSPSAPSAAPNLTLSGTAATGLALAAATITAKCATGAGSVSTLADGSYQLAITGGKLPCLLEIANRSDGSTLHTVAVGSGNTASANLTPLTEMLVARLTGQQPAVFFSAFDAAAASAAGIFIATPGRTLFESMPILEELLAPHPEVKIVLSTSWVHVKDFNFAKRTTLSSAL